MPSLRALFVILVAAGTPALLPAQEPAGELVRTIAELDASAFAAFNDRDVDRFLDFFADDLEFFHDETGLTGFDDLVASSGRLLSQPSPLRRRLVPGSLEVHPVPGYGAIQIGKHEFCHEEGGVDDGPPIALRAHGRPCGRQGLSGPSDPPDRSRPYIRTYSTSSSSVSSPST